MAAHLHCLADRGTHGTGVQQTDLHWHHLIHRSSSGGKRSPKAALRRSSFIWEHNLTSFASSPLTTLV
jgi:hypothetical protein